MRTARFPWLLWAVCLLLIAAAAYSMLATGGVDPGMEPSSPTQRWGELLMASIYATSGVVILSRRASNSIGWIFVAFGVLGPLQQLGISYAATCVNDSASCYLGLFVVLDGLWFLTVVLGLGGLFLLFPDGRIPSGRRWLAVSLVSVGLGSLALAPFKPDLYHLAGVSNPWAVDAPLLITTIDGMAGVLVLLLAVTTIVDFVWRARKATDLTRLQNRWLALAGLLTVLGGALSVVGQEIDVDLGWVWSLGVATIPVAVTMAITRHRLYDIDRLFSRTLSYALVVGFLGLVFAAGVVWLPSALGIGDTPLVVAGSTLAVAALFNPVRRSVQGWVDRRFNRTRYDTELVMAGFAGSLRDEIDPQWVLGGWLSVVKQTMQPAAVGVWVRTE